MGEVCGRIEGKETIEREVMLPLGERFHDQARAVELRVGHGLLRFGGQRPAELVEAEVGEDFGG